MHRTGYYVVACAALSMALGQVAQAIVIRADRTDSQYVNLGASSAYASVGEFFGTTSNSSFIASGP